MCYVCYVFLSSTEEAFQELEAGMQGVIDYTDPAGNFIIQVHAF